MNIVGSGSSSMISFSDALQGVEKFKNFFRIIFKYFYEQIEKVLKKFKILKFFLLKLLSLEIFHPLSRLKIDILKNCLIKS
jgi:hypothetical protein